jgi:UDPglucose 6-dehydrogenase
MRIAMVGCGYVGLVSGACLADFGHEVTCIDSDSKKIALLEHGEIPIYEEGLNELVARNVERKSLAFTTSLQTGAAGARVVFIAVGTPSRHGDGHADLRYIYSAVRDISPYLEDYAVVCTKSTVPVGTGDEIERIIRELRPDLTFSVVSNPEFLREGSAIGDFKRPDRVVIGAEDDRAASIMGEVYRPLTLNKAPLLRMSRRSAELTKYAANAFLATKITFINEIADLCEAIDANVQDVARGMGLDNRIGPKFLNAGPGYGGSCFPKDTLALLRTSEDCQVPQRIVETVVAVNQVRKRKMGTRILNALGDSTRGRTVAVLGLTFKPNTDDMRDSPAIDIVQALQDAGVRVRACDPEGISQAQKVLEDVEFFSDPYEAAAGADAIALVTEWDAYRALDLHRLRKVMTGCAFIDLRNVYTRSEAEAAGLRFHSVGKKPSRGIAAEVTVLAQEPARKRSLAEAV